MITGNTPITTRYYDFGFLLEDLGYDEEIVFEKGIQEAQDFIKGLDEEAAIVIKEWLIGFANETDVQHDKEIALAISRMDDHMAVIHYFAILFPNFWC